MKHVVFLLVVFSFLFSSCATTPNVSGPTSTPSATPVPSIVPTPTTTPLPAATATPTLSPDPNIYQYADNVPQKDKDLIKVMVRLGRYYLTNNFGTDISAGVTIILDYDPKSLSASLVKGKGYFPGEGFVVPSGQRPYIEYNVGSAIWQACDTQQFEFRCLSAHELVHVWQYQHGCLYHETDEPLTAFLVQGMAEYVGLTAAGLSQNADDFTQSYAFSFWPAVQFDENNWFNSTAVAAVAVKRLVDQNGIMSLVRFCDAVGHGTRPLDAFQTTFGISIQDFRAKFMDEVLGQTKICTMSACGSGSAVIGQFQLKDWLDPKITAPNLIARFVDDKGKPVVISNLLLARQDADRTFDNRQPDNVPGIFSANLFPGRYGFYFCEPGYPGTENTGACHAYETGWFDVPGTQAANITIQLPPPIERPDLGSPDLVVKFLDESGNPVPNLRLQVCNYDTPVKVCSPQFNGRSTDLTGVYQDRLRTGKYTIRFNWPEVGYAREWTYALEVNDVNVNENQPTNITYKFSAPNLVVKLKDAAGAPAPNHFLWLCNADHNLGNCANITDSPNPWSGGSYTDQQGVFKAIVKPGKYFILTDRFPTLASVPTDYTFSDINITSETETTTIEFQLK